MIANYQSRSTAIHKASSLVLFFIWPFAGLYDAFVNYKQDWSKNLFWLFCIFFGYTFIISQEGGTDSDRYARQFILYAHSDIKLGDLWSSFYSTAEDSKLDIVLTLLYYFVSRLTDNPSLLFTVFAVIFGYFYSRNIWYVLGRMEGNLSGPIIIFFITFLLLNPIWNINGFRFNAASQIFLFGTLRYLMEGKVKPLIWSAFSILVHFSFLLPVAVLIIFIFLKNKLNVYLIVFLVTSLLKEINLQQIQSVLLYLPDIFHSKIYNYANADYAEARILGSQAMNWYVNFSGDALRWSTYIMVFYTYLFGRDILKERKEFLSLFCFSLLIFSVANIIQFVPSGGRFTYVSLSFFFSFFVIFISTASKIKGISLISSLTSVLLLAYCIFAMRVGMEFFGLGTILGNPIILTFFHDDTPLILALKGFL